MGHEQPKQAHGSARRRKPPLLPITQRGHWRADARRKFGLRKTELRPRRAHHQWIRSSYAPNSFARTQVSRFPQCLPQRRQFLCSVGLNGLGSFSMSMSQSPLDVASVNAVPVKGYPEAQTKLDCPRVVVVVSLCCVVSRVPFRVRSMFAGCQGVPRSETTFIFRRWALRLRVSSSVAMYFAPAASAHARCSASPARSALAASCTSPAAR